MPSFPMYAQDFDMDTNTWTNEEIGVYLRLLLSEWINGPLPNDHAKLAKIARIGRKKFSNIFPSIKRKFHENGDNNLINRRLEEEREKALNWREKSRIGGLASAKARARVVPRVVEPSRQPNREPKGNSSSSSSLVNTKVFTLSSKLSNQLYRLILHRNPKFKKPNLQKWAVQIDRMIRLDKREPADIAKIVTWCQRSEFWQNNILSTDKLRKQFDQLYLKRKREILKYGKQKDGVGDDNVFLQYLRERKDADND